ncbi:hypothetical protein AUP68_09269 [Ilyonectria robusta]
MCGLYILSFLDRGNIGNAKAAGTQKDLGLTDSQWSWVLNAFYICYVCFEWTTVMWKILPAHIYVDKTEGAPTVAYSVIAYHFLPDSPDTAKYLTEAERTHAIERLHMRDRTKKSGIKWSQVFDGLSDYQNYVHTAIHFCCNFSYAALSNFLPTILREMGYSSVNAQGLTAPVYFVAFLCCIASAYVSDRYGKRGYIISAFSAMSVVGYLLLTLVRDGSQTGVRYAGIWFAACGIFPSLAHLASQQPRSPFYTKGCAIGCAFTGMIVILAMSLHFALERENKWRDRELGPADFNETLDVTEMGDKHRHFRYLT